MKLRQAKKILRNDRNDRCHYSSYVLHKAYLKFRPYLLKECERKNAELREKGVEHIVYAPYYVKENTPTDREMKAVEKRIVNTRYPEANTAAGTFTECYLQWKIL